MVFSCYKRKGARSGLSYLPSSDKSHTQLARTLLSKVPHCRKFGRSSLCSGHVQLKVHGMHVCHLFVIFMGLFGTIGQAMVVSFLRGCPLSEKYWISCQCSAFSHATHLFEKVPYYCVMGQPGLTLLPLVCKRNL